MDIIIMFKKAVKNIISKLNVSIIIIAINEKQNINYIIKVTIIASADKNLMEYATIRMTL